MDLKELKRLMEVMRSTGMAELELEWDGSEERPGGRVLLRRPEAFSATAALAVPPASVAPAIALAATPVASLAEPAAGSATRVLRGTEVTAPIVGTFYAAPSPDAANFVKVGDTVKVGQVLCIIEAMKLMNEIEAEVAGTIVEIVVRNEDPVEYGQVLMRIEPA
jgi:acetyl-CoA carboxylase biotin carboxyl carrier protein